MNEHVHQHEVQHAHFHMNMVMQIVLVLAVVALVAWAMLFAEYSTAHDFFHQLRHALYVIPCH